MKPSAHILQRLQRARFLTRHAVASTGIGDRKSKDVGAGMDFADYREYVPGDETRHLDARLYARHGKFYVRQFEVERQLPVTILIDGSASMAADDGTKLELARWLAAVFGYIALTGGDQVQLAFWTGKRLNVSRQMSGAKSYRIITDWIDGEEPEDQAQPFEDAFASLVDQLPSKGLLIVLSDFWMEDIENRMVTLAGKESEVWAMQVLSPAEIDPTLLPKDDLTLQDVETGDTVELAVGPAMVEEYTALFNAHQSQLSDAIASVGGRHHLVRTDSDPEHFVLHDLRAAEMMSRA